MASDRIAASQSRTQESRESRRKKQRTTSSDALASWQEFLASVSAFETRVGQQKTKAARFVFTFVEGPIVKALQNGDWVLLDEVNLATSETLESLSTLLQSSDASLMLTERGDLESIHRHPDFRLFACMNPATDIGKRDLPPALRTKFTEIYVAPPDADRDVLLSIVHGYVGHAAIGDKGVIADVTDFFMAIKQLSADGSLADGFNQPPHFSMRTRSRALTFASELAPSFGLRRALYEGCIMAFTTLLETGSHRIVLDLLQKHLVEPAKNSRSLLSAQPARPSPISSFVLFGCFRLAKGPLPISEQDDYILTPSVQQKLVNLARTISATRFPVLIQGPTSAGKTSIVEYLARRTGHRFVRINNHEHTDIQEYLGTYVSETQTGRLVYREGILVQAVRNGDWLVLDELNLAPTDVLEALNRLLDDNRELVIPETQEVITPHPHFMLFATQNPPGLYGGRKVLSRAFRNRFLEMHFTDVPKEELETILCEKCQIAPSYAMKIIAVFAELRQRRQSTRVFDEKQAFITLRDLFRWGGRGAIGYEQLAFDGYMLLGERARNSEDREAVKSVLESVMKVKLNEESLYDAAFAKLAGAAVQTGGLVWTKAMRRLYVLVSAALAQNEPVLLVGETGSGKTSVCQTVADARARRLHIVNCHQNTETADLVGGQRPIRDRTALQEALRLEAVQLLQSQGEPVGADEDYDLLLSKMNYLAIRSPEAKDCQMRMQRSAALFLWYDGPMVQAMRQGDFVLLDEISLADDSVLERLNSVLEPSRTLVMAEKGAETLEDVKLIAQDGFQMLATMNPGGDYGKKELSPALRNRFTEIWVPLVTHRQDIFEIINDRWSSDSLKPFATHIIEFSLWFTSAIRPRETSVFGALVTLRDVLAWVAFMDAFQGSAEESFVHGALMTIVDAIGSTASTSSWSKTAISDFRTRCVIKLLQICESSADMSTFVSPPLQFQATPDFLFISPFSISRGTSSNYPKDAFALTAPTILENARKVFRAMQVSKPILLEGSPGVGKTSLITALANLAGHNLCRINLSDQTDLVDLFGNDLPVEGGNSGEFAWRDAPFLAAMQAGHWVLLDEMNLASQAVLEGLNSCLDHRGSVFIPELDRSFLRHAEFRIFAAQNPSSQGGARKGLPKSFVDRFTQVFMEELKAADYVAICRTLYPSVDLSIVEKMVYFVGQLSGLAGTAHRFAQQGAPWELNLRDLLRWFSLMHNPSGLERMYGHPSEHLDPLFIQRFRNFQDRQQVLSLFNAIFDMAAEVGRPGRPAQTALTTRIGRNTQSRTDIPHLSANSPKTSIQSAHLRPLEALATALQSNSLAIVTGSSRTGKSYLVQTYASLIGRRVQSFCMSSQTDTLEMLGGFEQSSDARSIATLLDQLEDLVSEQLGSTSDKETWKALHAVLSHTVTLRSLALSRPLGGEKRSMIDMLIISLDLKSVAPEVRTLLMAIRTNLKSGKEAGRFEWIDGPLVRAMKKGEIFLIENANLCNASVLDRLNVLFEPQGKLLLTERGTLNDDVVEIQAHPNFRVVMTVNPVHGELSRAMRNRGFEIALVSEEADRPVELPSAESAVYSQLNGRYAHTPLQSDKITTRLATSSPIMKSVAETSSSLMLDVAIQMRQLACVATSSLYNAARLSGGQTVLAQIFLDIPQQELWVCMCKTKERVLDVGSKLISCRVSELKLPTACHSHHCYAARPLQYGQ